MTKQGADDLGAVRSLVEALKPFEREEQERIIRWAREKLGLIVTIPPMPPIPESSVSTPTVPAGTPRAASDLRAFVAQKQPKSDTHFAATVAYYYQFEAPEAQRKEFIGAQDLQEACRLADRARLKRPLLTLNNAHRDGLLDRGPERGTFVVNSVGENLVAIALPSNPGAQSPFGRGGKKKRKAASKKKKK
jgi:hypothetical protein